MIIGITGNYGSGKTTIANMFKELGFTLIDVDEIGHRVLDGECYEQVVEAFGDDILNDDLSIDREKLRTIVFINKDRLKKLESILHPKMIEEVEKEIKRLAQPIVIDAAVLFEMKLNNYCDKIITVRCNKQDERLENKEDIKTILGFQTSEDNLTNKSDFIINNNGSLEETKEQIKEIWRRLSPEK